jgi:hypothetical protein
MFGEREIMIDHNFLPEMSRAERAGRANKRSIPIVLPLGGGAAARRRHRAKQHRGYIGREKSVSYAFLLISCQPRPGGLGETQAVTCTFKF